MANNQEQEARMAHPRSTLESLQAEFEVLQEDHVNLERKFRRIDRELRVQAAMLLRPTNAAHTGRLGEMREIDAQPPGQQSPPRNMHRRLRICRNCLDRLNEEARKRWAILWYAALPPVLLIPCLVWLFTDSIPPNSVVALLLLCWIWLVTSLTARLIGIPEENQ